MLNSAKEKTVEIDEGTMTYLEFGRGEDALVILPGLSDGLKTVHGQKLNLAFYFRNFLANFRVYVFSRKNEIEGKYTTREMARDQMQALKKIGLNEINLMGISQGGMIAQHFAIDYPEMVSKLIIGVSISRPSQTLQKVVTNWIDMAKKDDYRTLMIDTMENTYSPKTLKKYRVTYPIISRIGKPDNFKRFIAQANACLSHNTFQNLSEIKCPTLVIGGDSDKVVGKGTSQEISQQIPDSELIIYKGLGHGAYEEGKNFNNDVMNFLMS